jgi:hypothetical protein
VSLKTLPIISSPDAVAAPRQIPQFAEKCPTTTPSRKGSAADVKIYPRRSAIRSSCSYQNDLKFKISIPGVSASREERIVGKGMMDFTEVA